MCLVGVLPVGVPVRLRALSSKYDGSLVLGTRGAGVGVIRMVNGVWL